MSSHLPNPAPSPSPIDEGDLLALIEGMSIPAERAARVREALASDPRLAELAALMRADREVVASLDEMRAPSDLLDRVEAQLERDALVGLAQNEAAAVNDELPVSVVVPPRKVWMTRRVGAPLAAAAAVALIAGGVLMMIPPAKKPIPAPPVDNDIATNDKPSHVKTPGDLAHNDKPEPPVHNDTNPTTDPATDLAAKPPTDAVPALPALPDRPVVAKATVSTADLLAAANEGRLMLRVRTDDVAAKVKIDAVNANAPRSLRVDALDEQRSTQVSTAFAGSFKQRANPVPPVKPINLPEPAPVTSSDPSAVKPTAPPAPVGTQPLDAPETTPVLSQKAYLAYVPAAAESLELLRKAIGTDASPAEWQILPRPLTFAPPTDAASVLWWTAPPAAWANRFAVPVVIQHN